MKNKIVLVAISLYIFLPISVFAKPTFNSDITAEMLSVNTTYEILVGDDENISSGQFQIENDPNNIEIISVDGINGASVYNIGKLSDKVISYSASGITKNTPYMNIVIKLKSNATGNYASLGIKNKSVNDTYSLLLSYNSLSSDATLGGLSSNIGSFDKLFSSNTTEYTLTIPSDVDTITLDGGTSNYYAKVVSGLGTISVANISKTEIIVEAENRSRQTYIINIKRENETNSSDSSLKSLVSSIGALEFKSNVYDYEFTIPYTASTVELSITPNDMRATYDVIGLGDLSVGNNSVIITVMAQDGTTTNYNLNIIRLSEDETNEITYINDNNNLKNLEISGYPIKFSSDITEYRIYVNDFSNLNIIALQDDENASINIIGNENLSNGSIVSIVVTASDGTNKEYKVIVQTKDDVAVNTNNSLLIILVITGSIILVIGGTVFIYINEKNRKIQKKEDHII